MNILIIDDNPEQLTSIELSLKIKGHTVFIAEAGKEALNKLKDKYFVIDMVVTDYAMPKMNGLELLSKIRKKDPLLPVVIMTAYGEKELLVQALRSGCDGFIEKPFTPDQLLSEIERVTSLLKRRGNYRTLPSKEF